jgi:starch phosphorylase
MANTVSRDFLASQVLESKPDSFGAVDHDEQRQYLALLARQLGQRADADSSQAWLFAAASAARDLLSARWADTQREDATRETGRRIHYLSMEFLMGRALTNALDALKMSDAFAAATNMAAKVPHSVVEVEPDAALGNGGLGRLAACFLDSMATLGLPSFGYGLRYENGMFAQRIQNGRQVEEPDDWLAGGNAWDIERHELTFRIGFGGVVVSEADGRRWSPAEEVLATAHDFIVPGHDTRRVSTLRQWRARVAKPLDLALFYQGEHAASAAGRLAAERLNWVLYPDDSTEAGRELRLRQEYLLVSASLQDILARHVRERGDVSSFAKWNAIHLNDTHPAIAPAELMRLLIDQYGIEWDAAWKIVTASVSYTNHTLMPEALETWPVHLLQRLLPRHLEIIYQINERFLALVRRKFPDDEALVRRVSLIDESGERRIRMAALAIVASHRVNGVSALHSALMVDTIFADYAAMWPTRFTNVTNGVTPRRWLAQVNPALAAMLDRRIGDNWRRDLGAIAQFDALAGDPAVGGELAAIKQRNKIQLAERIRRELGIIVNPSSLFDVHTKRIHEYKRQLLNLLHVIARYEAIIANPHRAWVPRVVVFAGKAASAYHSAKLIIQLIHDVGRTINCDQRVGELLKVVFLPNYGVSLAESIIPAADLSEQISTAGTEASGTGNMKFALNGALTIGTWDGANIEMAEAMGEENMFVFGLRTEAVAELRQLGYDPKLYVEQDRRLQGVIHALSSGVFSPTEPTRYRALADNLLNRDPYMLLADFASYMDAHATVDTLYATPEAWATKVVHNIAAMGSFSSDRTVQQYATHIWNNPPTESR